MSRKVKVIESTHRVYSIRQPHRPSLKTSSTLVKDYFQEVTECFPGWRLAASSIPSLYDLRNFFRDVKMGEEYFCHRCKTSARGGGGVCGCGSYKLLITKTFVAFCHDCGIKMKKIE